MIVWGGQGGGVSRNEGGIYDPSTDAWSATSMSGVPAPRRRAGAVWTGTRLVVWGGFDGTSYFDSGGQLRFWSEYRKN
jgi:hypothetical protein